MRSCSSAGSRGFGPPGMCVQIGMSSCSAPFLRTKLGFMTSLPVDLAQSVPRTRTSSPRVYDQSARCFAGNCGDCAECTILADEGLRSVRGFGS